MAISSYVSPLRAGKVVSVGNWPLFLAEEVFERVTYDLFIGLAREVEVGKPCLDQFFFLFI